VVDEPEACSFIVPAILRRGGLCVAISTGGASPTLAREVRNTLGEQLDPAYGELVDLLWRLRREWEAEAAFASLPLEARSRIWNEVARLPLLELLRAGDRQEAEAQARAVLTAAVTGSNSDDD